MIYAYLRLSTNEDRQKNSFDVQLKDIKKQFHITKIFKETISGSAPLYKRKALLEMLEVIKKNDKIIVLRLDRISRDVMQSGWIRYEIEKKGAELITLENTKKDATSNLMDTILLAIAEYEKETTKWRINKTLQLKRERGEALGGKYARYGFNFVWIDGKKMIEENPQEQKVINRIKKFRGKSARFIADVLASDGVMGKSGIKPIERKQVQRVLDAIAKDKEEKKSKKEG